MLRPKRWKGESEHQQEELQGRPARRGNGIQRILINNQYMFSGIPPTYWLRGKIVFMDLRARRTRRYPECGFPIRRWVYLGAGRTPTVRRNDVTSRIAAV